MKGRAAMLTNVISIMWRSIVCVHSDLHSGSDFLFKINYQGSLIPCGLRCSHEACCAKRNSLLMDSILGTMTVPSSSCSKEALSEPYRAEYMWEMISLSHGMLLGPLNIVGIRLIGLALRCIFWNFRMLPQELILGVHRKPWRARSLSESLSPSSELSVVVGMLPPHGLALGSCVLSEPLSFKASNSSGSHSKEVPILSWMNSLLIALLMVSVISKIWGQQASAFWFRIFLELV